MKKPPETLLRFDDPDSLQPWTTVDDAVMGGVSRSHLRWTEKTLRFEGTVSLEQNGGFCSARNEGRWDLSGASELIWTLRGVPRQFQATLRTAEIPESASFRHPFEPQPEELQPLSFQLDDFRLFRRGRKLSDEARIDPAQILSFGILLADKSDGPFWLELAQISYR